MPPNSSQSEREIEDKLLALVATLFAELHRLAAPSSRLVLDSLLERDLGLDSLARVELLLRVQRAFGVDLPEDTLSRAETVRDLLEAIQRGNHLSEGTGTTLPEATEAHHDAAACAEASQATTLLEVLDWHCRQHPERTQLIYCSESGELPIAYRDLKQAAQTVAAGLQSRGVEPGQAVAIMLPTCPEYFYTYFGILLAGGVPVPIYPPARLTQVEEHVRRHIGILANAGAALLVTESAERAVAHLLRVHVPSLRSVVSADELAATKAAPRAVSIAANDVAFIQYTSGSTGDPKGVALSHANLLANVRAMGQAIAIRADDVFVSWLPLYHDMGLIGAWLSTLYFGLPLVVMSPLRFLARPVRWLQAIHRHHGTLAAAPNFAYELCIHKIADEEMAGLDLSSWRLAFNGAEAVLPDTLNRFADRFAACGFRREALAPVYGLAECSVGLAFPPVGRGPNIDHVDRESLARTGNALPAKANDPGALRFVSCGRALPGHALRVVDDSGSELVERQEGRLEFRGPSATLGYFANAGATARLFHDGWLDSGDRAYLADGELFITGRIKDMIIRGGRNIYPHEVESVVGELPGVRKGGVVAFGRTDPASGTERLVVLAETRLDQTDARTRLRQEINDAVLQVLGEPADEIVLVPPRTVLKTSSGKLRRSPMRERYEAGLPDMQPGTAGWQIARLALGAIGPQLRRWRSAALSPLFAAWAWVAFGLLVPVAWIAIALTPAPAKAWKIGHRAGRLLLALTATKITVTGLENLPSGTAFVLVANHASYLDGLVLVAALPEPTTFVAKRELRAQPIARIFLEHLGVEFVERFSAHESVQDANRLETTLRAGQALAFFPEGTFTRLAGLRPFRLGAFLIAARTGSPLVPVAIRGTRGILRDGSWQPRHGSLSVVVGKPLPRADSTANAFTTAVALRNAARAHLLLHCGEPDTQ